MIGLLIGLSLGTLKAYPPCVPSSVIETIERQKEYEKQKEQEEREKQTIYMGKYELTAYIATGNPCADGVYPEVGHTVASNDPALWHKWIEIEDYGTYYVHDTGGMATNVIDIFVGSYDEAIQFGRRSANVYVKEENNEN